MTLKTILVTGATDGIGRETALELARRGARVIVHGRSRERVERVVDALPRDARAEPLIADLASLDEVRAMARAFLDRGEPLFALINNAGVYAKKRTTTPDGRELTMAVNHDAPVLLTHLVLDALRASANEDDGGGRVVCVSSIAHNRGEIDLDDVDMAQPGAWSGYGAYASSKLANVLFAVELARRLERDATRGGAAPRHAVRVNALHPGVVSTKLLKAGFNMNGPDSLDEGAATSVHLALDDDARDETGKYFVRSRASQPASAAFDRDLCARFYDESCRRVGVTPIAA